jgi:hypothetical protein
MIVNKLIFAEDQDLLAEEENNIQIPLHHLNNAMIGYN